MTNRAGEKREGFRIGDVFFPSRVVMAPMAGLTNGPFRRLAGEVGCRAFWTEMISAEGLVRRREEVMAMLPDAGEPHPVAVQLFGVEPSVVAEAAILAEAAGADAVDINMACPVRRLSRIGAGAALMKDPSRAGRLVGTVVRRVGIPVSIKIRAGWDNHQLNASQVAGAAQAEGAAAVVFHGRTRAQGFRGRADHDLAKVLVGELAVPVVVCGDIALGEDAERVLRETGAAAVMVGRAAQGNPWIFRRLEEYLLTGMQAADPADGDRLKLMLRHLDLLEGKFGGRRAVGLFRPHLVAYIKGRPEASKWRQALVREREPGSLRAVLKGLFIRSE